MLAFGCICGITYIPGEGVHIAQQIRSERESAAIRTLRSGRVECQISGPMGIARHSQIHRVTEIRAELCRMVSMLVSYVTYPLEFVFLLIQWAITLAAAK